MVWNRRSSETQNHRFFCPTPILKWFCLLGFSKNHPFQIRWFLYGELIFLAVLPPWNKHLAPEDRKCLLQGGAYRISIASPIEKDTWPFVLDLKLISRPLGIFRGHRPNPPWLPHVTHSPKEIADLIKEVLSHKTLMGFTTPVDNVSYFPANTWWHAWPFTFSPWFFAPPSDSKALKRGPLKRPLQDGFWYNYLQRVLEKEWPLASVVGRFKNDGSLCMFCNVGWSMGCLQRKVVTLGWLGSTSPM